MNKFEELFGNGTLVKIKSWDKMETEYKLDDFGDIVCGEEMFVVDMKYLCGENITITEDMGSMFRFDGWWITPEMVEIAEEN